LGEAQKEDLSPESTVPRTYAVPIATWVMTPGLLTGALSELTLRL